MKLKANVSPSTKIQFWIDKCPKGFIPKIEKALSLTPNTLRQAIWIEIFGLGLDAYILKHGTNAEKPARAAEKPAKKKG